jgi:hypothetical protein
MPYSNDIMATIDAALDRNTDDEFLIDDINSHRRPPPWSLAEDRV